MIYGIEYLRKKLEQKRTRVKLRYKYYDMKNVVRDLGISTPPKLRWWFSSLGWCAEAVDQMADRLVLEGFDHDDFMIGEIYENSTQDILVPSVVQGAAIGSCSFIYLSRFEDGYPRLQCINADDATGIIDPFTWLLQEGYAVLERDKNDKPSLEAYLLPYQTVIYRDGKPVDTITNSVPYPLLVPIIFRPDADRPFGHSRISRACMSTVDSAIRTIKRSEIAAEFYSFPQKYVTGLSQDTERMDTWKATMASILAFTKDESGESPKLGQFTQQSMEPHLSQLRMFASIFAGQTGLTLDDLGFPSDNPASVDAIKASHTKLRLTCRTAQRTFGIGIKNAGYLAACLRDDLDYDRTLIFRTKLKWAPLYEPDATMLTGLGDGINKINQVVPGYFGAKNVESITGIEPETTSSVDLTALEVIDDITTGSAE